MGRADFHFRRQKSRDRVGSRVEKSRDPVKPRVKKSHDPVKLRVEKSRNPVKPGVKKSHDPVKLRVEKSRARLCCLIITWYGDYGTLGHIFSQHLLFQHLSAGDVTHMYHTLLITHPQLCVVGSEG